MRFFITRITQAAALALAALFLAAPASADKAPGGFSAGEVESILPLLRNGRLVALSETDSRGDLEAMTLAVRVDAPRDKTFEVFEDPSKFYYLSPLFKENEVLQEHGRSKSFSWASRHKLFSVVGRNTIHLFPPRRADVHVAESTIGEGTFTVTLHEDGPEHTIVVVCGALDVRSSEWLIRYLLGGNPAIRQAMNVAIGIVMTKGIKTMAERIAEGEPLAKHRTRGRSGGKPHQLGRKALEALAPLLARGTAVVTESRRGGRLRQASVIEVLDFPARDVLAAVSTPDNYGRLIKAIDEIRVHRTEDESVEFSWSLGFSVFDLESRNRMTRVDGGVLIEAVEGEMPRGKWRWQIVPVSEKRCAVAYHGFVDLRKSAYILKKTVRAEPYLEHGLLAGSNMVLMRAIRLGLQRSTGERDSLSSRSRSSRKAAEPKSAPAE